MKKATILSFLTGTLVLDVCRLYGHHLGLALVFILLESFDGVKVCRMLSIHYISHTLC